MKNEQKEQKFFTVPECASLLRCNQKTILRRIWRGTLTATKPPSAGYWLIPVGEIHKYLDKGANL